MTRLDAAIAAAREAYVLRHPRDLAAYVMALAGGAPRRRGLPCPLALLGNTCLDGRTYTRVGALPVRLRPGVPARAARLLALDADEAGLLLDADAVTPVPEAALTILRRRPEYWDLS